MPCRAESQREAKALRNELSWYHAVTPETRKLLWVAYAIVKVYPFQGELLTFAKSARHLSPLRKMSLRQWQDWSRSLYILLSLLISSSCFLSGARKVPCALTCPSEAMDIWLKQSGEWKVRGCFPITPRTWDQLLLFHGCTPWSRYTAVPSWTILCSTCELCHYSSKLDLWGQMCNSDHLLWSPLLANTQLF